MEPITRLLIEDILIFAYCDQDQIDDDFAVFQLERIAGNLALAGEETVRQFIAVVRKMEIEAQESGDADRAAHLASMPSHLGLL